MFEKFITAGASCLIGILLGSQAPKMGRWMYGLVAQKKSRQADERPAPKTPVVLPERGKKSNSPYKGRIINYLRQNPGRYSLQDLASALGVHFMRLMQSLNRLVESGVIRKKGQSYELAK